MTTREDLSHRHLDAFVDWIRPEPETRPTIITQSAEIRSRIKGQAETDGLVVRATPNSGSFAKKTGLRRHMRGGLEVEGQDIDLPFVMKRTTDDGDRVTELLRRFDKYAAASYPSTPRRITGSSVELTFSGTGLRYDLVPMLATSKDEYQVILKSDGTRRLTSISRHIEFVEKRTSASATDVKFNECVRLMKWWRCVRLSGHTSISKVRTMLMELLCASAFDRCQVKETYTDTLHSWFTWLAHVTGGRMEVKFGDYLTVETFQSDHANNALWKVLDPVNVTNNVVPVEWGEIELEEFSDWFAASRDAFSRIVSLERSGRTSEMEAVLKQVFGSAVITHGATA